jgi:hypothetical protein
LIRLFFSRKGFFALNAQAICDAERRFLGLSICAPGSTNDNLAWDLCSTAKWLKAGGLHDVSVGAADELGLPSGFFLVGDNAYTNSDSMAVPFQGSGLTHAQELYNYSLVIIL